MTTLRAQALVQSTNAYNATNVNAILTAFSLTNAGGSSAFCNGTYTFQDGLAGTTSATWTNVGGVVCDYNASYGWQIHNNVALCYTNAAPGPSPYPFPATYSDAGLYNNPELSPAIASYIWTTNVVLTTNILTQTQIAVNTNNPSTNAASIVGSLNIVGSIWLNGTNLAASVTSNVNATNVNFIAGTGTIYTAPGGSNSFSINPILVATNNEAAMFCATNGLTGPGELFDLSLAVQSEKNYGAWTSLVQASIYRVNFAPSNHIALVGNPWSVSNEVFGTWGARDNGTNQYFTPLPTAISNYCVSICYQVDVSAGNNAQMGIGQALLSTYNTNTLDSTLMILPSSQGPRLVSSSGSTFNGGFVAEMFPMQSGVWADNFRAFPADPTVVTYSVSNGWLRAFVNGNVAIFNTLGTNVVFNTNYTAALNALVIGNGGPAWSALGGVTRVAGYSEHSVVLIHNVPWEANPNIPKADFAFGRCLEKPTLLFVGASRLNYRTSFNNVPSQGMPLTNDPVTLYQQISPEVCVLENAYPGNSVSQYANMGGTYGGRYAYIPPIVYLPWQKCAGFFTDAGGNDVLFGYGISAALASFNGFWNQYSNIAPFTLFARGSDNLYYTNSALLPTYYRQQLQSFPFANFVNEGAYLTSNWLAHVSQETNAEHVGNGVGIVYYDAVKDTVIHWKTGKQPNVFGYNDATAAVPNSTVPFSQMKFVMRDTNNLELLTLDGSTLTNISGGGGSSALPASTNNIWNLTNSANTLAGTLSGSLNGVTGSIGTITMTGGSTLTGGNINSGNGTFSGTVTASNYVTAGYSPGTIFLDTNYWGYGSTANYSGNRTNDIFQITIHCTGGLPADHATFLTNVFGVTYGDIPLVDVAPYGDSTRILGYQGGPIGVTSASQTNVVVGIYGAYTPGPGTYILNFKVNR